MGQAGAQREPSMEEILASIRRIIENNDPADLDPAAHDDSYNEPAAAAVHEDHPEETAEAQDQQDDNADDEARAYDPSMVKPSRHDDEAVAPAISLADVAARVRSTPDLVLEARSLETAPAAQAAAIVSAAVNDDLASRIEDDVAEELRQALVSDEPVDAGPSEAHLSEHHDAPDAEAAGEKVRVHRHDAEARQVQSDKVRSEHGQTGESPGGQLVSLHTGEKVAAAFGELSAAIAAGQTRSFDEIAEEMLKPMLTQWLDDNLPTLVERLVREEIERVSRGNRG